MWAWHMAGFEGGGIIMLCQDREPSTIANSNRVNCSKTYETHGFSPKPWVIQVFFNA